MVYCINDPERASYGFQIMSKKGDVSRPICEMNGFSDFHQVFTYVEKLKQALLNRFFMITSDPRIGLFQFIVFERMRDETSILLEETGWRSTEEANEHILDLISSIQEGTKMDLFNIPKNRGIGPKNIETNEAEDKTMLEKLTAAAKVETVVPIVKPAENTVSFTKEELANLMKEVATQAVKEALQK